MAFVFSSWLYAGAVGQIQSNMYSLIRHRTLVLFDFIFRGMFNFQVMKGVGKLFI